MSTKINFNEWKKAIEEVVRQKADVVPKGWITKFDLAKELGISETHTYRKLKALFRAQLADIKKFKILGANGNLQYVTYFKLRKPDANHKKLR